MRRDVNLCECTMFDKSDRCVALLLVSPPRKCDIISNVVRFVLTVSNIRREWPFCAVIIVSFQISLSLDAHNNRFCWDLMTLKQRFISFLFFSLHFLFLIVTVCIWFLISLFALIKLCIDLINYCLFFKWNRNNGNSASPSSLHVINKFKINVKSINSRVVVY